MNVGNLLGALVQSGMSGSTTSRITSSLGGGGALGGLAAMLGGTGASGGTGGLAEALGGASRSGVAQGGGSLGGMLGNVLNEAGKLVGGKQNLALGGLGALAGAIVGGGKRSAGGALGGGVMALLGVMAFQALKARAGTTAKVPVGFAEPKTDAEKAELSRNSELVLRAMLNAAKADGEIDDEEVQRILGKVEAGGADAEARSFLRAEMKKPMETAALVAAAKGRPELAAQLYSASLLAIEVDTQTERDYLDGLAKSLGLQPEVTRALEGMVGLKRG